MPVRSAAKNPPAKQETQVQSLGQKPREFHEQKNLASNSPWGCKESDTTEQLTLTRHKELPLKEKNS